MSSSRIHCIVPGCRHTRGDRKNDPIRDGMEWICGDHWKLVPAYRKKRKSKAERAYRKRFGNNAWHVYPAGSPERLSSVRLNRMCQLAWRLCKTAAIERALGI